MIKKNGCWNVTWNFVNVSVLNAVTILTLWKQIRKWVDETSKCITHSNSNQSVSTNRCEEFVIVH